SPSLHVHHRTLIFLLFSLYSSTPFFLLLLNTFFFFMIPPPPISTLFPYTTLFRSYQFSTLLTSQLIEHFGHVYRWQEIIDNRGRSEEHTSELQSRFDLVCRLLLEKKNT